MGFEEANKGPATTLIVQREKDGAQELENAIAAQYPGTICVREQTVQGAIRALSMIGSGQLKMIVVDPLVDLEGYKETWVPEGLKFLKLILKNKIFDSGSILLFMAYFLHPELYQRQAGLLARPVRIISTGRSGRANDKMRQVSDILHGTVFEIH